MNDATIIEFAGRDTVSDPLTDLLRKGARELLQTAVEAELDAFLAEFAKHRTPEGRAAVVRNGHHPERAVQTGIGPVTVQIPKVRSKTGAPVAFRSALVPPTSARRSRSRRRCPGCTSRASLRARWAQHSRRSWARTRPASRPRQWRG